VQSSPIEGDPRKSHATFKLLLKWVGTCRFKALPW